MSSKSKTQSTAATTQTTALDPQYSGAVYGNVDRASNLANSYQPYNGQLVAGFNPTQTQAQQGLLSFANNNTGVGLLNQAEYGAQQASGYQPANVNAQQIAPNQLNAAQLAGTDLSPYMNPYQSSVIDATTGQYDRQNQIDLNNARGRASAAGAFGGSGSALLQAQTQEANGRTLAQTLAGLNQTNFTQAQGAAQSDVAARNQVGLANQNTALSAGQSNQSADLAAQQGNQAAGQSAAALRLQASGILAGLSDQERQQVLQNLGAVSAVGDAQQGLQQSQLDAQHQAYTDQQQQQMAYQQLINQSLGLVPQTGTTTGSVNQTGTTTSSPGLTGILGGIGGLLGGVGAIVKK